MVVQSLKSELILHFISHHTKINYLTNFELVILTRLKRTTDIMFGGKQVLVCGYGEVKEFFYSSINQVLTTFCSMS